jgi:hypothetical protein
MAPPTDDPDPDVATRAVAPPPLRLDDLELVPEQTTDDTDSGWDGSRADPAADVRRYLAEKPPHHG